MANYPNPIPKKVYNWFYYNGHYSTEYGLTVSERPSYTAAEPNYETISIPGRNGEFVRKTGTYKNRKVTYDCWFFAIGNVVDQARRITEWLNSSDEFTRLEDSYDPEYFSKAIYVSSVDVENRLNRTGRVTITFTCKPERWLKTGQEFTEITEYTKYDNDYEEAKPLFRWSGGDDTVESNFYYNNVRISGLTGTKTIYIDAETQNVYDEDGENRNPEITLTFVDTTEPAYGLPSLPARSTSEITPTGTGTLEFMPRSWRL